MNDPATAIETLSYSEALSPYVGVFVVAWLVTILCTPLVRYIAVRRGIVDWPDLERKRHREPVAYLGGIAICAGWLGGIIACLWVTPQLEVRHVEFPLKIVLGALIITTVGMIDDVYGISPRVKVGGQLIAAAMVAGTDIGTVLVHRVLLAGRIPDPVLFGGFTLSYVLGAATIALMVLGSCNAVNLLDGLDGLVTGVLSICCIGFVVIACEATIGLSGATEATASDLAYNGVLMVMCLAILGALLGFLPHNFNPANIFMGDAGSLLLGYLCATTIMLFGHAALRGPLLVMAALIVFALPITDTALAIFRRLMARQPIFTGDSHHLHHQLVRTFQNIGYGPGVAVKLAVAAMYALAAVFTALGCLLIFVRWRFVIAVFAVIFGFVVVIAYKTGRQQVLLSRTPPSDTGDGPGLFDQIERPGHAQAREGSGAPHDLQPRAERLQ